MTAPAAVTTGGTGGLRSPLKAWSKPVAFAEPPAVGLMWRGMGEGGQDRPGAKPCLGLVQAVISKDRRHHRVRPGPTRASARGVLPGPWELGLEPRSKMESPVPRPVMLATLGGCLALLLGIAVLLLPLLTPELSRPRDTFWGAVVLLLGLVLVTSAERLTGAPMLAVLCGGLLIGRLGGEVGRGRWNQLSVEERSALATTERWASGFNQLAAALTRLLGMVQAWAGVLAGWLAARRQPKSTGKLWVRPEEIGRAHV